MIQLGTLYDKAFDVPYHLGRAHDCAREHNQKQKVWHLQAARAAALRVLKLIDAYLDKPLVIHAPQRKRQ